MMHFDIEIVLNLKVTKSFFNVMYHSQDMENNLGFKLRLTRVSVYIL